jgi:hypothetical protein
MLAGSGIPGTPGPLAELVEARREADDLKARLATALSRLQLAEPNVIEGRDVELADLRGAVARANERAERAEAALRDRIDADAGGSEEIERLRRRVAELEAGSPRKGGKR